MSRPTLDRILRRYEHGKNRLLPFFNAFDEAEELYDGDWEPTPPGNYPATTPATAAAIIDEATDHIDTWNMEAEVPTRGAGISDEAQAGKLKQFLEGMWLYWSGHGSDIAPLRDAVRKGFLADKMVGKLSVDWDRWPEPQIKRGMNEEQKNEAMKDIRAIRAMDFPLVLQSLSPRFFIDDPTIGRKKWGIEFYEKDTDTLGDMYPQWVETVRRNAEIEKEQVPPDVELVEYWEEDVQDKEPGCWRAILAAGIFALEPTFLKGYPLPYVVKYAGLGRESYDGRGQKKARGLLWPVRSLLRAEGRRLTQLDVIIGFYATPTLFTSAQVGDFTFEWAPAVLNFIGNERWLPQTVNVPTPHAALIATIDELRTGIERAVGQPILRGAKPAGTRTSGELETLSAQASLRFLSVSHAAADLARQVNEKAMQLLARVVLKDGDEISIPTALDSFDKLPRLKKSDIPQPFYHRIHLGDTSPQARQREALVAMQKFQNRFIDLETALEEAGYRNSAEMRLRIMRDMVMFSPIVVNSLGKEFVQEYAGIDVDEIQFEEALKQLQQEMALQAIGGGMGGPGINQAASPSGVSRNAGGGGVATGIQ